VEIHGALDVPLERLGLLYRPGNIETEKNMTIQSLLVCLLIYLTLYRLAALIGNVDEKSATHSGWSAAFHSKDAALGLRSPAIF
jgi:hypothetical protein